MGIVVGIILIIIFYIAGLKIISWIVNKFQKLEIKHHGRIIDFDNYVKIQIVTYFTFVIICITVLYIISFFNK